ncbi:hypothetical protein [Dactylosporangium sp. CA-092794]|uniref:hypothetical protein n=1 Tax=Dactylosporangium sp. CA-092794 TaxID=3239929 RepID=UPI003D8B9092
MDETFWMPLTADSHRTLIIDGRSYEALASCGADGMVGLRLTGWNAGYVVIELVGELPAADASDVGNLIASALAGFRDLGPPSAAFDQSLPLDPAFDGSPFTDRGFDHPAPFDAPASSSGVGPAFDRSAPSGAAAGRSAPAGPGFDRSPPSTGRSSPAGSSFDRSSPAGAALGRPSGGGGLGRVPVRWLPPERRHPNAGRPWASRDMELLLSRLEEGADIKTLTAELGRSEAAVRSRLQILRATRPGPEPPPRPD